MKGAENMTLQEIITHFQNVRQAGENQYSANCPACGDTKRHLYISEAEGKVLLDCKKGCTFNEVVQASGLKKADFFPPKPQKKSWEKLREHLYTDEEGKPLARKIIYDKGNGSKTAIWERFENGTYIKGLNGLKVPPYTAESAEGVNGLSEKSQRAYIINWRGLFRPLLFALSNYTAVTIHCIRMPSVPLWNIDSHKIAY